MSAYLRLVGLFFRVVAVALVVWAAVGERDWQTHLLSGLLVLVLAELHDLRLQLAVQTPNDKAQR